MPLQVKVLSAVADVPRADWDALIDHDPRATPFVSFAFLDALEQSGCASKQRGWQARHLTLWRDRRLVAAAPAYEKRGQDGADFARDWHFAEFARHVGIRYYPKLVIGVPITPVTGRRILCAPDQPRAEAIGALLTAARELAREDKLSAVQVLFPLEDEAIELQAAGMAVKLDHQAHWFNKGYADPDAWLKSLTSKRRHQVKREKAAPAEQGITIRTVRGGEILEDHAFWAKTVWSLYRALLDGFGWWGGLRLNEDFFLRVFKHMGAHCEVVEAKRDGRIIAGAWNVSNGTHLFGRYWGCVEQHPFLHFNVCLYHSIDDCIRRGLQVFEGGAGGHHKVMKGFDVAPTYSLHSFLDPRLDTAIRGFLRVEGQG